MLFLKQVSFYNNHFLIISPNLHQKAQLTFFLYFVFNSSLKYTYLAAIKILLQSVKLLWI